MSITYCFTRDEGKLHEAKIGHHGPHQIGLGLVSAGVTNDKCNGRWVIQEALSLAEGYLADGSQDDDTIAEDIELVRPLLERQEVRRYYVEITNEEKAALRRILEEAQEYWSTNNYASDENEDDRVLGQLADHGLVAFYAVCADLKPVIMERV